MTARQRAVLLHCAERGYYGIPRRATLRTLAAEFGISPTTLSLILRRAERSVVRQFVLDGAGPQEMPPLRATPDGR